ncbi:MAG: altronate dehydratase [Bacteroidaceae bacterium]|nr:altronate dehydratase [Bacteroidaceae bacterium]
MKTLQIHPADNVAVMLDGEKVGHKIALRPIAQGETVVKYGFPIGHAVHDIADGALVDHNDVATNLSGELDYSNVALAGLQASQPSGEQRTFMGYERADGQVGIRNELWIVPTVGCVNGVCQQILRRFLEETGGAKGVDAVTVYGHNYGCSQLGDDHENTRRILRAMVHHPNAGGVLVVGLGCENNQPRDFQTFCGHYNKERVRVMVCQELDDEVTHGVQQLHELYALACRDQRTQQPAGKLRVGLKCGGSDGFSGITANPLLGAFSDWICGTQGGTTVLTEVPEMFGAETILMERCLTPELKEQTVRLVNDFKRYFISHGQPVGENPSPGNKAGGISTLEEKALGCTQKSGTTAVCGVLGYGEQITSAGLNLLSAPGNDLVASTALAASGCQLVLFTTGRGTPFGTFVPTIKVSTNNRLAVQKPHWIDFNAGVLLDGITMEHLCRDFTNYVLAVASGKETNTERTATREIAIFKTGVTL